MMKSNIDLTSNEMFSRRPFPTISIREVLFDKFPWVYREMTPITCEADMRPKFEGILTGNKEEIERKKLYKRMDAGNTCDRCGKSLEIIPWDRHYDLCQKCWEDLEKEYGKKYPWEPDPEIRSNRNILSLI